MEIGRQSSMLFGSPFVFGTSVKMECFQSAGTRLLRADVHDGCEDESQRLFTLLDEVVDHAVRPR